MKKLLSYEGDDVGGDELSPTIYKRMSEYLDGYSIEKFEPVEVNSSDEEVTKNDLVVLNAHIACNIAVLPNTKTLDGMCKLAAVACKLIETRRKVMKLPYGEPTDKKKGNTFEVIE